MFYEKRLAEKCIYTLNLNIHRWVDDMVNCQNMAIVVLNLIKKHRFSTTIATFPSFF